MPDDRPKTAAVPARARPTRRAVLALGAAALAAPTLGGRARAQAAGLAQLGGWAFGTAWRVVAAGPEAALARHGPAFLAALETVDRQMSPWRADSEVSALNRGAAGAHAVSEATARVTGAALDLAARSGGAFDPSMGPLVARWGFGPIAQGVPGGWRGLSLAPGAVAKAETGLTLDLCGIAKGWALDRMAAVLASAGPAAALLDLGGELRALGAHPAGRPWQVAVEAPRDGGAPVALLALAPEAGLGAVATSGLARQSYEIGGRRYGHIVDPARAAPAAGPLLSVSVLSGDAMTADGWATALAAAGAEAGPELARAAGLAAVFVHEAAPGGRLRVEATGAAEARLL